MRRANTDGAPIGARFVRILVAGFIPISISIATSTLLGGGCSDGGAASCPTAYPTACPSVAPTFAAVVAPVLHARCTICHAPGQQVPTLDTYAHISAQSQQVFFRVQSCAMPPPPRPPLTLDERDTILNWIVCGAMND
jgi:uncharacterized membrane protein